MTTGLLKVRQTAAVGEKAANYCSQKCCNAAVFG